MEPNVNEVAAVLPEWATAVGSLLVFLTTFGFAAYGWIKSRFPSEVHGKPAGGDAVVLSAAIADSRSIAKLADAIERLCDNLQAERDLTKLQAEVLHERLKLILGELRKSNERDERDDNARRSSLS